MKLLDIMNRLFRRPYRWATIFSACLTLSFAYILLDTFVIPRPEVIAVPPANTPQSEREYVSSPVPDRIEPSSVASEGVSQPEAISEQPSVTEATMSETEETLPAEPVITENSYVDENIQISIETLRRYDTDIYVADIQLPDAPLLKTAFAQDTFGRNIKDTTSAIAERQNAIFAVNGDNYGSREAGFVLRNGTLYRDSARTPWDDDALLIDMNGDFRVIHETQSTAETVADAWQVLTFGPALLEFGELVVDGSSEVTYSPHSNTSNPRTAIGQIAPLHYLVIVTDGRTSASEGLTLLELGELFAEYGCETAYNLDGGGSSTMVFMGKVVNQPTTGGRYSGERKINDIVYIGYE